MAGTAASLPPGPALPRTLLTLGFVLSPARFMDHCRRRCGDVVFLSTALDRGFVLVFDSDVLRGVFQARPVLRRAGAGGRGQPPPAGLRAGEAHRVRAPRLGARWALLLGGAEPLRHRR